MKNYNREGLPAPGLGVDHKMGSPAWVWCHNRMIHWEFLGKYLACWRDGDCCDQWVDSDNYVCKNGHGIISGPYSLSEFCHASSRGEGCFCFWLQLNHVADDATWFLRLDHKRWYGSAGPFFLFVCFPLNPILHSLFRKTAWRIVEVAGHKLSWTSRCMKEWSCR